MRGAVYRGLRQVVVEDVPDPECVDVGVRQLEVWHEAAGLDGLRVFEPMSHVLGRVVEHARGDGLPAADVSQVRREAGFGRRAGDPAELVAANAKIRRELGWQPAHDDLELIIRTAWEWEKKLIEGWRNEGIGGVNR